MKVKVIEGYGYQMDTINQNHDPLDGKVILNHYGEPLYFGSKHKNNEIIECELVKLTQVQLDYIGYGPEFAWVYFEKIPTERTFTESETLKMLEALRQKCSEENRIMYHNGHTKDNIELTYFQSGADNIQPCNDRINSIDLTQFLPPLNKY